MLGYKKERHSVGECLSIVSDTMLLLCRFLDERVDELRFVPLLFEDVGCFLTDADGDSHVAVSHGTATASATAPSWVLLILCHSSLDEVLCLSVVR